MESAVGVPEELAAKDRDDLTPMIAQYVAICEEHSSELVLFHVGDFYKAFGEAAETVARLCELTLTSREDTSGEYRMAGLRVDSAETHLQTLLDAGYRIAIAEQVEDPESVSGVAKRAVTQVITPGTLTEAELLDPVEPNYVMSITATSDHGSQDGGNEFGFAFLDISTGAFFTSSVSSIGSLRDEVSRIGPVEVILGPAAADHERLFETVFSPIACERTDFDPDAFQESQCRETVAEYFGQLQGASAPTSEVRACGALLEYAEYTRAGVDGDLDYITQVTRYDPQEYMQLNDVALRGLELFERRAEQSPDGATLVDVIDDCSSALGSRKVREWLRRPLLSAERIRERHDAVQELIEDDVSRAAIRDLLEAVYDIERLSSKIARGRADARDIRSLHATLAVLPELRERLAGCESALLGVLHDKLPPMTDVRAMIDESIAGEPAAELTEGGIIAEGYNDELDNLRETVRANRQWIEDLEATERERTGIDNLRVGHTEVHGYYIEVTQSHLDEIPEDYTRRQTLKQAERFYTPELQEREDEIITSERRANELEYELFTQVRDWLAQQTDRLQKTAEQVARLDALSNFAEFAAFNEYTRPEIAEPGAGISIERGRHPVVEQTQDDFVPNGTTLDRETFLTIVTGPNMSGKSTYLRQVALIVILAQCGSFVPADSARIGVVDQILTRIGASDDITGGKSTFMVEMTQMADILHSATENSLLLLDEVGRGTSTADGYALACAVSHYIHDEVGAMTFFATHHHELTRRVADLDGACNRHFSAEQRDDQVVFHYNISEGPATASYGVDVAREAGVPADVITDANAVLEEANSSPGRGQLNGEGQSGGSFEDDRDASNLNRGTELGELADEFGVDAIDAVVRDVSSADVHAMTPIEAIQKLDEWQARLEEE